LNNDPEVEGKNFETLVHLLDRVVKGRKSRQTVSHNGSWVDKMLKRMKEEESSLHGDEEG
jgi:hypothetical protein